MYLQMSLSLLFFVLLLKLISNLLISLDKSLKQQVNTVEIFKASREDVFEEEMEGKKEQW